MSMFRKASRETTTYSPKKDISIFYLSILGTVATGIGGSFGSEMGVEKIASALSNNSGLICFLSVASYFLGGLAASVGTMAALERPVQRAYNRAMNFYEHGSPDF